MKLVMTLLVRNEEDILAANLDFHLSRGVDFFIITDNLSSDGTRSIIEEYARRGLAQYLHEAGDDFSQYRWVTRMARMAACDHGADWVINSDADEFWTGAAGSDIKHVLKDLPPSAGAVVVPRFNFIPVEPAGQELFAERMLLRERKSRSTDGGALPPKVCHRACPHIDVDQGNHGVRRGGVRLPTTRASLRILHYPMRSYAQFEAKIVAGGRAYGRNTDLPPWAGATWRKLYDDWSAGALRGYYQNHVLSPEVVNARLSAGELVHDDTVAAAVREFRMGTARA